MPAYDWDYWRHRFVAGDDSITLKLLSEAQNAPSYDTMRKRSSKEFWDDQRKQFRHNASTFVAQSATAKAAEAQVAKLVDAAELITRHLKLSRAIQDKAAEGLRNIDSDTMAARDVLAWIKEGTQIERLALGLATERVETQVEVSGLSDEQLQRLVAGEDIDKVVAP